VDAARRSDNGASLAFATAVWADVRRRAGDLPGALASYLEGLRAAHRGAPLSLRPVEDEAPFCDGSHVAAGFTADGT
jgi:hypothetical protein